MDLKKLVNDLVETAAAAKASVTEVDDLVGSCNFDAPVLVSRRSKKLEATIESLEGFGCFYHRGGYVISARFPGQGQKRTKAAERMRDLLEERGYEMSMHYAAD